MPPAECFPTIWSRHDTPHSRDTRHFARHGAAAGRGQRPDRRQPLLRANAGRADQPGHRAVGASGGPDRHADADRLLSRPAVHRAAGRPAGKPSPDRQRAAVHGRRAAGGRVQHQRVAVPRRRAGHRPRLGRRAGAGAVRGPPVERGDARPDRRQGRQRAADGDYAGAPGGQPGGRAFELACGVRRRGRHHSRVDGGPRGKLPQRVPTAPMAYPKLIASLWTLFANTPVLRRRAAYHAGLFGSFSLFWTVTPMMLASPEFHLSQTGIAIFALVGMAGAVSSPVAGRLADAGHTLMATAAALALGVAGFALPLIVPGSRNAALALLVIASIVLIWAWPPTWCWASAPSSASAPKCAAA